VTAPPASATLLERLYELRARAIKAVLAIAVVFIALIPFANDVFRALADPLMSQLPSGSNMISKDVASPFLTPLKSALWATVFLGMPVLLYQIWKSVELLVPATGRKVAPAFLAASVLLFYGGIAFAYWFVMPMVYGFFANAAPAGVAVMTDIAAYLDFTIGMLFAFGLAFQMPIAIVILLWTGIVSRQAMVRSRPYVFLGAFVVGMFLTPPDVFSQTLLAVPMYMLFEGALLFCKYFLPDETADETADDDSADA
jgi:sec-independent protein translocase protein TatC